uniref:Asp/Glu/hydantoin racemase n=1 Tax=viral metagenome TaxID=1070528 RepID=A0A6C0DXA2_9ZZZZ
MKLLIIDSTNGAKTLINSIKRIKTIDYKLVKLELAKLLVFNKHNMRDYILKLLFNNLTSNINICLIMCVSASSSILDILIKNNFVIANVLIIEPILPICLYIKKRKFKTLLILSSSLTQKIKWFSRILNSDIHNVTLKYATLNLSENDMTNNVKISSGVNNLINYKAFIDKCDGILLGCSSYSLIKNIIAKEIKSKYNYQGELLDSSVITFEYFSSFISQRI